MEKNTSNVDRIIRLILGVLIVGAGIFYQSWWGALGLILLVTAGISYCPIYALFGISTCPSSRKI